MKFSAPKITLLLNQICLLKNHEDSTFSVITITRQKQSSPRLLSPQGSGFNKTDSIYESLMTPGRVADSAITWQGEVAVSVLADLGFTQVKRSGRNDKVNIDLEIH
jgi:hypothetical protein